MDIEDFDESEYLTNDEEIKELSEDEIREELYIDYLANSYREALDDEDVSRYSSPEDFIYYMQEELKNSKKENDKNNIKTQKLREVVDRQDK
jgi:hypothetical protein